MVLLVKITLVCGTFLAPDPNAQEGTMPASGLQGPRSSVILRLRAEADRKTAAPLSRAFWAVQEEDVKVKSGLSAKQADLARRLEKLTCDVIKAWLLRDLDAAPAPSADVLAERLAQRGERLRARVISHAEAILIEGVLTPFQAQTFNKAIGRKPIPLLGRRFGPQTPWVPAEGLEAEELARQLQHDIGYVRAGDVFNKVLGGYGLSQFLDPKTKEVPTHLLHAASGFMPAITPSKDELDLASRLNSLTIEIFRAWLTRDLDKTPLPSANVLRQRLIEHRKFEDSLFAHVEAVALEGILTPEHAETCLNSMWRERGMRALVDPALAARLRLSKFQRYEVARLLKDKAQISDWQSDAQQYWPLIDDVSRIAQERIVRDARERLDKVDAMIWAVLTPTQARILGRILGGDTQRVPRSEGRHKQARKRG